jgi:hypothetical protein
LRTRNLTFLNFRRLCMPKVGETPNLPTTDPYWTDQRLMDGKGLTPDEAKVSKRQSDELGKVLDSLRIPVQKDDWKTAKSRNDGLIKQFEALSPEDKKFMYQNLQTNTGIAKEFHYRLSTAERKKLLTILNPEHKTDKIQKYSLNDAREKNQRNVEMNLQNMTKQLELQKQMQQYQQEMELLQKQQQRNADDILNKMGR